jgi:RHS repeat-associated protein
MSDDMTSLQWNLNRWYDAKIGRWSSEDPIGFNGSDMNLYRYASNRILMTIDAYGLVGMVAGPISKYVKKFSFSKTYQVFVPKDYWWEIPILSNYHQVPYHYNSQTDYEVLVNTTTIYNFTLILIGRDDDAQLNFPIVTNSMDWKYLTPEIIEQNKDNGFNGYGCRKHYYVAQKCTECERNVSGTITGLKTYLYTYDLGESNGVTSEVSFLGTHIKCITDPTLDQIIWNEKSRLGDNFVCKFGEKKALPSGYVSIDEVDEFKFPRAEDWIYPYQHRGNNPW